MLRLDKFLSGANLGSRSQVKEYLKQGLVRVNGEVVRKPEYKIEEGKDRVSFREKEIIYKKYVYYMLNKPQGIVSATRDRMHGTVSDLLKDTGYGDLFPVGRLDRDTEGLLIMTNDGGLAHDLLSPKNMWRKSIMWRRQGLCRKKAERRWKKAWILGKRSLLCRRRRNGYRIPAFI